MLELLSEFSASQIIIYTIMLALAIKGGVEFFNWCKQQYQIKFDKDYQKKTQEEILKKHCEECETQFKEALDMCGTLEEKIDNLTDVFSVQVDKIESQLSLLSSCSRNDIKAWIVETHHRCIKEGCIDDFTKDTVERRFQNYKDLGGNSYIEELVKEIRELPLK